MQKDNNPKFGPHLLMDSPEANKFIIDCVIHSNYYLKILIQ